MRIRDKINQRMRNTSAFALLTKSNYKVFIKNIGSRIIKNKSNIPEGKASSLVWKIEIGTTKYGGTMEVRLV